MPWGNKRVHKILRNCTLGNCNFRQVEDPRSGSVLERKDGAARAFIDFVESSDLETAQNAFIQCCNEVGMDTQGTIDTFYVDFKEAIKVLQIFG